MIKKLLTAVVLLILVGIGTAIYMWNKPHPKVEDTKGIGMTAEALSKEYTADEKAADTKYLNKAIEVSGTVGEIDHNQDGGTMVVLQTGDPAGGVQCAMRDKQVAVTKDQKITIKGFCSGNGITGVSLTDCVIK
jgi:putative nucleic acid binding protein